MKNRLSVSLLALNDFSKLDDFLDLMKKNDIRYIELPITKILPNYEIDKGKIKNFLKKISRYKIKISSVQAIFHKKKLNVLKIDDHEKIIKHLSKILLIAKLLKTKNLIFGSPKNRIKRDLSNQDAFKIFKNLLGKIQSKLIKNNMNFCIEPNSKYYGCDFILNSSDALKFINYAKIKNLAINFDTGNALLEKDKMKILKKHQKYFKNFQVSEKDLLSLKKDTKRHKQLLRKFDIKKQFISLETLNVNLKDLKKDITLFKSITGLNRR
jgi:sugar phosphate isomerase/epimerase